MVRQVRYHSMVEGGVEARSEERFAKNVGIPTIRTRESEIKSAGKSGEGKREWRYEVHAKPGES
jgi:hypothetical protein